MTFHENKNNFEVPLNSKGMRKHSDINQKFYNFEDISRTPQHNKLLESFGMYSGTNTNINRTESLHEPMIFKNKKLFGGETSKAFIQLI